MSERISSDDRTRSDTIVQPVPAREAVAFDETLAPASAPAAPLSVSMRASTARTTVLPRVADRSGAAPVDRLRYEEMRPLGAGGQAEVTLTRDHDIDRVVAIKRLLPDRRDDAAVLRFTEEIRTVGQLEHPNIVPIHDVGVDGDGQYFFVMKYVDGETLDAIIARLRAGDPAYLRRYTAEYRLQICNEVLRGVQYAHELGVLHRDLKPSNVMVGAMGEVVIMDWGLAKRIAAPEPAPVEQRASRATSERARLFETQAGALLGTPAYMSPEQAAGRVIDARSDLYSLAVVFYEFLCLRHPRAQCESVAEMIAAVCEEPIGKLQILGDFGRVGAPAALAHFVRHALDRDPQQRYPSAAAMRERLESVRDGVAPIECHVTFTQRVLHAIERAVDRRPIFTLGVLLAVGATVVIGVTHAASLLIHASALR